MDLKYALASEKNYIDIDEKEYDKRMILQSCIDKIKYGVKKGKYGNKILLKEQQVILQEYFEDLIINNKLKSPHTIRNNINPIFNLGIEIRKPFSLITNEEIKKYLIDLKGKYADTCFNIKADIIKRFFKWLGKKGECSASLDWLNCSFKSENILDENDLPNHEEIKKMAMVGNKRDSCFLMVAYEGALRLSECCRIKLKDITWNDDCSVYILVNGKTGKRRLLFIDSVPFIKSWLQEHPFRDNPNAALFVNRAKHYGRQLKQLGGWDIVKKLAKRAGIEKKIRTHKLRHARLNYLAKYYGFNERDLRKFAGWTGNSNMPNVYLHYDMDVVDDKIKGVKGMTNNTLEQQKLQHENMLKGIKCDKCGAMNPSTNVICDECNEVFEVVRREKADNKLNKLFADDEFKELVKDFLKNKNLEG
ncbi:site-specific integrase [archaeon]|nr:site-specific integrase [archaeon]